MREKSPLHHSASIRGSAARFGLLLAMLPAGAAPAGTPEPVGDEFQVNTYTTNNQFSPSVAAAADGDFVVVWESHRAAAPDSLESVQGQRFASSGAPVGDQFQVNTYTSGRQAYSSVAAAAGGDFVVVWESSGSSGSDSSLSSIQGQRFAVPLFADDFESGNTSAWSSTVP